MTSRERSGTGSDVATLATGRLGGRWLVAATVTALAAHLVAAGPFGRRTATAGEATTAAVSVALARLGGPPHAIRLPDLPAGYQLAVLSVLVAPLRGGTVMDTARASALAVGLIGVLLLWPVGQRMGLRPAAIAAGMVALGVPVVLAGLHSAVDAGALAALWLTAAATIRGVDRRQRLAVAGLLVLAAVATAPLAAVPALVLLAQLAYAGTIGPGWDQERRAGVTVQLVMVAAGVAVLATGRRPLAVLGDSAVPESAVYGVVAAGFVLAVLALVYLPWAHSIAMAALATVVCAMLAGPATTTATMLVLPLLAVLLAALLDEVANRSQGAVWRPLLAGLVALAVITALALPAVPAALRAGRLWPAGDALARWITTELEPGTTLAVDDLAWAQLVRDGVPAGRLHPVGGALDAGPPPPDALVVRSERPGRAAAEPPVGSVLLAAVPDGPGEVPAEVRRPATDAEATTRAAALDLANRVRVGGLLAGNAALTLSPAARGQLLEGAVDARLILVLASFASAHRLAIDEFPAVPVEPSDAPRRSARITAVDGRPAADQDATALTRQWLQAQLPPYRPLAVADDGDSLFVRYSAPAPLGLLGP